MKIIIAAFLAAITGCSIFGSKEASVFCQVADATTTVVALKTGAAEANPFVSGVIKTVGLNGFVALKLLLAYWLYTLPRSDNVDLAAHATVNVVTCATAVRNFQVYQTIK